MRFENIFKISLLLCLCLGAQVLYGQTIVKGTVTDAATREVIPFATIQFGGTTIGVKADIDGHYELRTSQTVSQIKVSSVGYKPLVKSITPNLEQTLNVKLSAASRTLNEFVVKPGKIKYRNKDNPAVELIRNVIEHKSQNRMEQNDYYQYEQYEKMQFALSNVSEKLRNRRMFRKFQFVFDNVDTTRLEGKPILPMYLQESIAQKYFRKDPKKTKTFITANKVVRFDQYIDNDGLNKYMKHLYQDIDIYDNNITILTNQFLSPIADAAPTFYKFYITDTLVSDTGKFIKLAFYPRNKTDFLFQGDLYISLDSNYAVQKADMTVNKNINLNWVRELRVVEVFERNTDGKYAMVKNDIMADFGVGKDNMGIFGERMVTHRNTVAHLHQPDSLYAGPEVVTVSDADKKNDDYWSGNRHEQLTKAEANTYQTVDSLQHMPSFKRVLDIATILFAGYKSFGPVEVGPINTFYSFNPVEGFRLRVGGRTTPQFSKRINFETYVAYGFKDQLPKFYLGTTYSLTNRSIYEFPVRSIRASFQRDTKIPGQELQFVQEDNFLLSFKRGVNDKWLYNNILNIDYLHEFANHFSYKVGLKYWTQEAAGGLRFTQADGPSAGMDMKDVTTSEVSLELRWAPKEQFYQGKTFRIPISNRYPVFTLRGIAGFSDFLNSGYRYQSFTLNMYKRFYLSQLGYTDVVAEGGYINGQVPFPLLSIHRANQTYSYQLQSYNMMNFLEFVSDHYVSLNIDHNFNGFIFNKIPVIKKLKWREVITFKGLYGGVRKENDPAYTTGLLQYPTDEAGRPTTFTLASEPYIEGSVGVANIFKFFRLDLVKRFTYLDNPNVSTLGLRFRFKFDF
jgi:hypothetical protein